MTNSGTGPKSTGSSGIRSGLQPGGTRPLDSPGANVGSLGTGGGSTDDHATGTARTDDQRPRDDGEPKPE
ncbi:hypothetical protein BRAS3843_650002 [Bradyrhizobium sp. STM 3843]|uniref:hypothetical protein n=1 Tax=Bradyrhizobium sp. STM 3843 TaxID=551947 RepID=UPI000240503F|nr:hypothetical protein [Bradyrhizobium sp. STM 3843]CCE11165.1 hypothetical protein BRAS3843_650002 [Bradyrhizobium sp. STM 3843]